MNTYLLRILLVALAFGFSGSMQASLTIYADQVTWSSAVGAQTATAIPNPDPWTVFGQGDASVAYGGVTFSTSSTLGNGLFKNLGYNGTGGSPAVLSDQQASSGVENILITLPSAVTAFSLHYGTFYGSDVTFTLGNGETFTRSSTASFYGTLDFSGATDTTPFSTILVTSPDFVLNINNLERARDN